MASTVQYKSTLIQAGDIHFREGKYLKKVNYKEASGTYTIGSGAQVDLKNFTNGIEWDESDIIFGALAVHNPGSNKLSFALFCDVDKNDKHKFSFRAQILNGGPVPQNVNGTSDKILIQIQWYARELQPGARTVAFTFPETTQGTIQYYKIPGLKPGEVIVGATMDTPGAIAPAGDLKGVRMTSNTPYKAYKMKYAEPVVKLLGPHAVAPVTDRTNYPSAVPVTYTYPGKTQSQPADLHDIYPTKRLTPISVSHDTSDGNASLFHGAYTNQSTPTYIMRSAIPGYDFTKGRCYDGSSWSHCENHHHSTSCTTRGITGTRRTWVGNTEFYYHCTTDTHHHTFGVSCSEDHVCKERSPHQIYQVKGTLTLYTYRYSGYVVVRDPNAKTQVTP